jgi:hypothetical protein
MNCGCQVGFDVDNQRGIAFAATVESKTAVTAKVVDRCLEINEKMRIRESGVQRIGAGSPW